MSKNKYEFLGLCAIGGEVAFNNELKQNGFALKEKFPGRLFFSLKNSSDLKRESNSEVSKGQIQEYKISFTDELFRQMIKANMKLQLADRIAFVVKKFSCDDFDDLFDNIYACNWDEFFHKESKVVIERVSSQNSKLNSVRAIQSVAQKAIYKKLCTSWNVVSLPESAQTFTVRLYLENNIAYLTVDLSGEPLHKRSYRLAGGIAPMRETLAASLLQIMHWKRKTALHDPFCGSGTIPIEASLYAHNVAPGLLRSFAFQDFAAFSDEHFAKIFEEEKSKAVSEIQTGNLIRITGSDIDENAVSLSIANAENACSLIEAELRKYGRNDKLVRPDFVQADIAELSAPYNEGLLLGNPPYGERIGDEKEAFAVYEKIAESIKDFSNWQRAFITSCPELKEIINKYNKRIWVKEHAIKSGNIDTVLYEF